MTIYQWLCVLGIPTLVLSLFGYIIAQVRAIKALKLGVQALLRAQMIHDYNRWKEEKYAPIYAKENFENCWVQYEALGMNGVMKGIHDEFMTLPISKGA